MKMGPSTGIDLPDGSVIERPVARMIEPASPPDLAMPSSTVSASKEELRSQFRAYRDSLSPSSYAACGTLISHRALTVPAVARAQTVHVYWPMTEEGEVDTRPLIGALRGRGAEVILPVVTSFDPDCPTLKHCRYEGPEALETNQWGICEPANNDTVDPKTLDVVIVPALGAGRNGHRLGHGTGYYDAFLQSVDCPRVALVYEACLLPAVPSAPHDVPMTTIVTERDIVHVAE